MLSQEKKAEKAIASFLSRQDVTSIMMYILYGCMLEPKNSAHPSKNRKNE